MAEADALGEMQDRIQWSRPFSPRIDLTLCSSPAATDESGCSGRFQGKFKLYKISPSCNDCLKSYLFEHLQKYFQVPHGSKNICHSIAVIRGKHKMPQGSCLCGKLTYSYDNAVMKCICHCLTCRKLTGSTYATALLVPEGSLETNTNPPLVTDAVHEVGMKMQFHGCDSCPSTLYKTAAGFPNMKIVFAGTLDGKDDVATEGKPGGELWVKYRVPWLKPLEGCRQFEEFPPAN